MASKAPVGESSEAFARAHAELARDASLQFDRAAYKVPERPGWLDWIDEALRAMAPVMKWAFWIGVVIVAGLILYALAREILRLRAPLPRAAPADLSTPEWRPDAQEARDLLAAADALAASGRFAEAAHLILLRSVEDIVSRRPRAVRPALTTREIASLEALPASARPAFTRIGQVVEASLFGGAAVSEDQFAECRAAYQAFALPDGWRA